MSGFIDMYLDDTILSTPIHSAPKTSTTIVVASGGDEGRNQNWAHPLRSYSIPEAIREQAPFEAINAHWLIVGGPFLSWPFTDPLDFASVQLDAPSIGPDDPNWAPPEIGGNDQTVGVGDGFNRVFQLQKSYTRPLVGGGLGSYSRPIILPQLSSVLILMRPSHAPFVNWYTPAAVPSGAGGPYTYEITRPGGEITFTPAPAEGTEIEAGFFFDVQVRFETDDAFAGIVQSYRIAGFAAVNFVEVRPC